ncbi:MAG: hypothetical protein IPL61_09145 [Myxococcales bacterium]|nr:hypothetical protein [Myxococcales bacterium]
MSSPVPSLRPSLRPVVLGVVLGVAFALVAALGSWMLVRGDARRDAAAGVVKRGPYAFVGGVVGLAAAVGYGLGRRLGRGRSTRSTGWVLSMARVVPRTSTYRDAAAPSIAQLVTRLTAHGYQLEVRMLGADGALGGAADPDGPLVGGSFRLRDPRLGPTGTGVELWISALADRDDGGLGTVRALDLPRSAACAELAQFAIVELGAILPTVRYRPDDSGLSADPVEVLRSALPDRPRLR